MTISARTFVFADTEKLWRVARKLEEIERHNFGFDGFPDDYIARDLIREGGVSVLLLDDEVVVGYTSAINAREVYEWNSHYRGRNFENAAYISNSSIHPDYQHKGHIWLMMEKLEEGLLSKGYHFLDRDTKSDTGYADKVIAHYGDRVIFANPPELTMWGHQRYIRIRL